eukprot:CAMPEP_0198558038 /NCGR_PEP_ID=MMETSP1462-20131121/89800_1 /TAXON_ID=1333877 /ORGANISM="Brandtodinium nutriculum, Strain RCC3387" /LENGTH=61 /DNA_ID=CAMNT_0044288845 /DNA_START=22 /DNA_END=204 /DNA_ORIENTATION=+
MCVGMSSHDCVTSIFNCNWKCQYYNGVCTGGSMCDYKDASSCEASIFHCKWSYACPGQCYG